MLEPTNCETDYSYISMLYYNSTVARPMKCGFQLVVSDTMFNSTYERLIKCI